MRLPREDRSTSGAGDDSAAPDGSDGADGGDGLPDTAGSGDTADTAGPGDTADTAVPEVEMVPGFGGWPGPSRAPFAMFSAATALDLDGDGLLDLVACRDDLGWALNPGGPWVVEGALIPAWSAIELDDICEDIDGLDIDGDGDLDVILSTFYHPRVLWYENDGAGALSYGGALGAGIDAGGLAVGDFDGDGLVDAAASPLLFWNDGGGAFTTAHTPCAAGTARYGAPPVLPGGASVLTCTNSSAWVSDAERAWSPATLDGDCGAWQIDGGPDRAADLDGDGDLDTLVSYGTEIRICVGDGAGSLSGGDTLVTATRGNSAVSTLTDANRDGWVDFAALVDNSTDGDVILYHGSATGFVEASTLFLADQTVQGGGALYRDLDGDGAADLLAWNDSENSITWFTSDGAGGFFTGWSAEPVSNRDEAATAADLDGDGAPDLVSATMDSVLVYWNDGPRSLSAGGTAAVTLSSYSSQARIWPGGVELDGDLGEEALVMAAYAFELYLLDGEARGFTASGPFPSPGFELDTTFQHAADLDGDGDDELLIENAAIARGDIDGDGIIDIPEALLLGGTGEMGMPTAWSELLVTFGADPVFALVMDADLDGDGLVDIAEVNTDGLRVWGWDGGSGVSLRASSDLAWAGATVDPGRRWLSSMDADGDGDLDLLLGLRGEAAAQYFLNDGVGLFSLGARIDIPAELADDGAATVTDLTGDGFVEAWSATQESGRGYVQAWRDASFDWQAVPLQTVGITTRPTTRDLDGDGVLDLVGGGGGRIWVYWGLGEVPADSGG